MKIPKYVQDLMSRSRYVYNFHRDDENYAAGYTIKIRKHSEYGQIGTLEKEVDRLVSWANRVAGTEVAHVLDIPQKTHYCNQTAVVTIFDPVMKYIENYIPNT